MQTTSIKSRIKKFIQYIYFLFVPQVKMSSNYNFKVIGDKNFHFNVGYYDIDPIDSSGANILCHKIKKKFTNQIEPEIGEIGLLSINSGNFQKIAETKALNWQLGSRAQWLGENEIIFNDIEDNLQVSKIFDTKKNLVLKTFKRPFWAISNNKKLGVSLNFSRIKKKRPGYGYAGQNIDKNEETLTIFNLETDSEEYRATLKEIFKEINFSYHESDPYLNHIAWSPCSKKFLTIFHYENEYESRKIFPIIFDLEDKNWSLIDSSGYFSHHVWLDDQTILAHMEQDNERRFFTWTKKTGWTKVIISMPKTDGHPSPMRNGNSIVVDTYPNVLGKMSIFLGSADRKTKYNQIGRVINLPDYNGPLRCDLHPRTSKDSIICDMPTRDGRKILLITHK